MRPERRRAPRAGLGFAWTLRPTRSLALLCTTVAFWPAAARIAAAPEWQSNAKSGLERAVAAYFVGNSRVEAQEFALARAEIARTGRPALVARAELLRCASRVASLVLEPCSGFDALRIGCRSGRARLCGLPRRREPARRTPTGCPEQHRPLVAAAASPTTDLAAIERMGDPFSRLVGAAVSLQAGRASPAVVGARGRCRLGPRLAPAAAGLAGSPASLRRARRRSRRPPSGFGGASAWSREHRLQASLCHTAFPPDPRSRMRRSHERKDNDEDPIHPLRGGAAVRCLQRHRWPRPMPSRRPMRASR